MNELDGFNRHLTSNRHYFQDDSELVFSFRVNEPVKTKSLSIVS